MADDVRLVTKSGRNGNSALRMIRVLYLLIFLALCFRESYQGGTMAKQPRLLTADEIQGVIDEHNNLRSIIALGKRNGQPPAANMIAMEWDDRQVKTAQTWSDACKGGHNKKEDRTVSPFSYVGQNYAGNYGPVDSVDAWYNEVADYTFDTKKCNPGKMCGHYTQVVWAKTKFVGCGQNGCKGKRSMTVFYCDYAPGGNMMGEAPYEKGKACSKCPQGYAFCLGGALCASWRTCGKKENKCTCTITACKNGGQLDKSACFCKCAEGFSGRECEEPCKDTKSYCESFKGRGYCDWKSDYNHQMKRECKKACGWCAYKDDETQNKGKVFSNTPSGKEPSGTPSGPSKPAAGGAKPKGQGGKPAGKGQPTTKPGAQPGKPGAQPAKPGAQPAKPGAQPAKPGAQPAKPGAQPAKPGAPPAKPGAQTGKPGAPPAKPGAQPAKPGAQTGKPGPPQGQGGASPTKAPVPNPTAHLATAGAPTTMVFVPVPDSAKPAQNAPGTADLQRPPKTPNYAYTVPPDTVHQMIPGQTTASEPLSYKPTDQAIVACVDIFFDKKACAKWAQEKLCTGMHKQFMLTHCAKSCNYGCPVTVTVPIPTTTKKAKPCPAKTTKKVTTTTTATPCVISKSNTFFDAASCDRWAAGGQCTLHPRFMQSSCAKSCKVCTPSGVVKNKV